MTKTPYTLFSQWFAEAKAHPHIMEPSAMTLATVSADAKPSARIVLLKDFDTRGFTFYTNSLSRKGTELSSNPHVALVFYWMPLKRQIRIEGSVSPVGDDEADAYFATRERGKQIGAWASLQSQPLDARETLLQRVQSLTRDYEQKPVPRPPHWKGYCVTPHIVEFWEEASHRLHDRLVFTLAGNAWHTHKLYP